MSNPGSVTYWIGRLEAGDREEASRRLWDAFAGKVVEAARARLAGSRLRTEAEDVALNAFNSFLRRASAGRFPRLKDSSDLWALLLTITCRKAARLVARGSGPGKGKFRETPFSDLPSGDGEGPSGEPVAKDPDHAEAAAVADGVGQLLGLLSPELCQVALFALDGYTNAEIGQRMNWSEGTIGRKLRLIRETWKEAFPDRF